MHLLLEGRAAPPRTNELAVLADEAAAFHRTIAGHHPTPCHELGALAATLGVASLALKDESHRLGLNAFKVLGASFAIDRWLRRHPADGQVTFTTATDGNHGRAVAWAARQAGHRAVVFIPAHARPARVAAIRGEGADVVLVEEGYDAAVRAAHAAAQDRGWIEIQDTASSGYEEVPEWIAAGYWSHARELEPAWHPDGEPAVDLVLLHAGVGTWAAAIVAYYWHRYGARRPRIALVEPETAPCVLAGIAAGGAVSIDSPTRTVMAGLDCALASTTAVRALAGSVDAAFTIGDQWALEAMRRLATPSGNDPPVVAGESGAAGLGGLLALRHEAALAPVVRHLGLDAGTRVLVWSTEGATDPDHWQAVVGRPVPT
jgi:diaminopropionate ammonia-lyase